MLRDCPEKAPELLAVRNCLMSFEAKRQARSKPVIEETNLNVRVFNAFFEFLSK